MVTKRKLNELLEEERGKSNKLFVTTCIGGGLSLLLSVLAISFGSKSKTYKKKSEDLETYNEDLKKKLKEASDLNVKCFSYMQDLKFMLAKYGIDCPDPPETLEDVKNSLATIREEVEIFRDNDLSETEYQLGRILVYIEIKYLNIENPICKPFFDLMEKQIELSKEESTPESIAELCENEVKIKEEYTKMREDEEFWNFINQQDSQSALDVADQMLVLCYEKCYARYQAASDIYYKIQGVLTEKETYFGLLHQQGII